MLHSEGVKIKDLKDIVVLFSGDSGDGMQLSGTIFSNVSAILGNEIATFPDYPAEIRAPQGTLSGVSGFQVHIGSGIYTAGDKVNVLVAMNPAALKVNVHRLTKDSIIIIDTDSFQKRDLEKAAFKTEDPFAELNLPNIRVVAVPITTLTKESLNDYDLGVKDKVRCKNMFALGIICWLFGKQLDPAYHILTNKFSKKPLLAQANIKVMTDGFNYAQNTDTTVSVHRIETAKVRKGFYTDVNGNTATAYGLIAAAEKAKKELFLGSYPITPATDILHELVKRKDLGVKAIQMEDEIAGICTAIGASFAGDLAATSTSGPGLALKSEAIGLAVMAELPLVIIDVQRGGPSTGLPTKTEQTDLRQALYGRNGESPIVVVAASSPTDCFDTAYWASKIALEHITPVIMLTDGYIANGSSAWRIPDMNEYPDITPHNVSQYKGDDDWTVAKRDEVSNVRFWAEAGTKGFTHRIGGLERDYVTGSISTNSHNHQKMVNTRQAKIDYIANSIPELKVIGKEDADLLIIGWGGTYGHLREATEKMNEQGKNVALAHFQFINPLPRNTKEVLAKYKNIVVAEQNNGHFAGHLLDKIENLNFTKYNRVEGQPFSVEDLIEEFSKLISEK